MLRRRACAIPAILAGVTVVLVLVFSLRSISGNCGYPSPTANLPASLRAEGGFDQAFDAANVRGLQESATLAATTLNSDLIGTVAASPVTVVADSPSRPDAVVVPLTRAQQASAVPRVVGLVIFLRDCSGALHYSRVDDLGSASLADFPAFPADIAGHRMGVLHVTLEYSTNPARPRWVATGIDRGRSADLAAT